MKELVKLMDKEDHFDLCRDLGLEMFNASEKVLFIIDKIEGDMAKTRQALPIDLANIQILIDVIKEKFAVSEIEWKEKLSIEVENRKDKYKQTFSDMEF
jgi:hypothetical protein